MKGTALILLVGALMFAQQATPVPPAWTVSGIVQGTDGSAISGAVVSLTALPPHQRSRLRAWSAVTGRDGFFSFQALYPGQFQVCAQVPGTAWLDPCRWGLKALVVTLSDKQPTVSSILVIEKGAMVPVRISDPSALLDKNEGITSGAHLLLGLSNDRGAWEPATLGTKDSAGRTYLVVVPFDRPIKVTAASSFFGLASGDGIPLERNGIALMTTVTATSAKVPPTITISVIGVGARSN